jgi:hypothetical protein
MIFPFVVVVMRKLRGIAPPGLFEGGRVGGRNREIVVFSFSAVYAVVAMVTRFRVIVALFEECERDHENFYIVAISRLITC